MAVYFEISGTPAAVIDLAAAKRQLRIDPIITYDDTRITEIIDEATAYASSYMSKRIGEQTVTLYCPEFITDIEDVISPVSAITSIKYFDVDGNEQTLNNTDYKLYKIDEYTNRLVYTAAELPQLYSQRDERLVTITATVGYTTTTLPNDIRSGIMLLISYLFENRNDSPDEKVRASQTILRRYKEW